MVRLAMSGLLLKMGFSSEIGLEERVNAAGLAFVMRRVTLVASFIALMAALVLLWNYRFEPLPGLPVWRLADLRAGVPEVPGVSWHGTSEHPRLRLKVDSQLPSVALRLGIHGAPALHMLQLRYRMVAKGLTPGKERWHNGRMMVEWHAPDGSGRPEMDPVGGIELDWDSGPVVLVAVPADGPAIPALRLEHLGMSGEWELAALEITAVRERLSWRLGSWALALCWLAWFFACLRSWQGIIRLRALVAASIWLLMGIHFAVPGPWKIIRPLAGDFRLGQTADTPAIVSPAPIDSHQSLPVIRSKETAAQGEIVPRGNLALRIKILIAWARPLLHSLL